MDQDSDMTFWRQVNKDFDQDTEHRMTIRAALEYALGDEAKLYAKYFPTYENLAQPDSKVCGCGHITAEHIMKLNAYGNAGCLRCNCQSDGRS